MKRYIFLLTMLVSSVSFAQEVLTIRKAVNIALEENYGILTAKNTSEISRNNATIGNAGLFPKLDVSAMTKYTNSEQDSNEGKVDVVNTQNNANINLSYTLVNGLGNIYNYRKLKLLAEGSNIQAKYIIETTVFNVVNMFYAVATQQENFQLSKEMLEISKERLLREETKTKLGTGSSLDALNARVDYNKDSVNYINAEKKYLDYKRNLNTLLSRRVDVDYIVNAEVLHFESYNLNELLNNAFDNNSDYIISLNKLDQSKCDLKIANTTIFPTISLTTSYGYNKMNQTFDVGFNNSNASLTTGLSLSWNIFDGKKKSTQRRNAKINIENAEYKLEEQRLNIHRDITNAYATYDNSLRVLEIEKSNIRSAELNFKQSKEYYNLGQISSTRFREAQLNLLAAKNNISIARYSAKVAEMDLNRICGLILKIR